MITGKPVVLGRLTTILPREVWPHEALDFTPWLLKNVDVLSELLGMELVLDAAEHAVGSFSLDLIGRDEATGGTVIVENQLEVSDHTHLGQILTYAAGTDPTTVVWIAARFRDEHRAALDWLNSRTNEATRFFGVEIGVVRIGQSDAAPSFRLVVQPNDWEKTVRATTAPGEPSTKQLLCTQFWTAWMDRLVTERPQWSRALKAPNYSWYAMPTGLSGCCYYAYCTKRGLSSELDFESRDAELKTVGTRASCRGDLLLTRATTRSSAPFVLTILSIPQRRVPISPLGPSAAVAVRSCTAVGTSNGNVTRQALRNAPSRKPVETTRVAPGTSLSGPLPGSKISPVPGAARAAT